jgi:hypothetical protein
MSNRPTSSLASMARERQVPWEHQRAERVLSTALRTRASRARQRPQRVAIAASCLALFVGVGFRFMSVPAAQANATIEQPAPGATLELASAAYADGGYARD